MRSVAILAAGLAVLMAAGGVWAQEADKTQTESLVKQLERYIGHELAPEQRAVKAGVRWLLPESCPPFYLRDIEGKIIDPTLNPDELLPPVSVFQTCMKCKETHDPNVVMKGYHFQMGRDEMFTSANDRLGKSPGLYGKWSLFDQRILAPKTFDDPDAIDMTSFDWVLTYGTLHPGGGPAAFDRGGRRYDTVLSQEPTMAQFRYDGDYYGSRWHETGVLEADCLICHMPTYNYSTRAQQIKKLNFKWASTEAAGLGVVDGSIADGDVPVVKYNMNLFGADGRVNLTIRRPEDRACAACHSMMDVQKCGTAWHNPYIQDVHSDTGVTCTDCHTGDIRHNFAKGDSLNMTVRDDLDNTMLSCKECHYEEKALGAPAYDHPGIPPIHLERLSCESCHITKRPFLAARVLDSLTGKVIQLPSAGASLKDATVLFGASWGTLTLDEVGSLKPLSREQVETAANLRVGADSPIRAAFTMVDSSAPSPLPEEAFVVRDFVARDGALSVDTDSKRMLMLLALEETLNLPQGEIPACLFRGVTNRVLKGRLTALDTSLQPQRVGQIEEYPVTHLYCEKDGAHVAYPMGYQTAVLWAFRSGDEMLPLTVTDMAAAWQFVEQKRNLPEAGLSDGESSYQFWVYPATPRSGEAPIVLPNPAETEFKAFRSALMDRMKQYDQSERTQIAVYDDNHDLWPEVNNEQEMGIIAWAIARTMKRLEEPALYYIKGQDAYRITVEDVVDPYAVDTAAIQPIPADQPFISIFKFRWDEEAEEWKISDIRPMPMPKWTIEKVDLAAHAQLAAFAQPIQWNIAHGVEPAGKALGAKACTDCHSMDSDFFFTAALIDPFDEQGQPVTRPVYELQGFTKDSLQVAAIREQWLKPYTRWVVLAVLAVILLHYAFLGIKQSNQIYAPDVQRFSLIERTQHVGLMATVVYLAVTGFFFLLGKDDPLGAFSRQAHTIAGYVATAFCAVAFVRWMPSMLPQKGDLAWLLHLGGYLGGKGHYPAHKFNAGQKILFWKAMGAMAILIGTGLIMALNRGQRFPLQQWVYFVHDVAALAMILLLMGHIYLGVLVNPHSLRAIFGGKVSSLWAKEHHPDWELPS